MFSIFTCFFGVSSQRGMPQFELPLFASFRCGRMTQGLIFTDICILGGKKVAGGGQIGISWDDETLTMVYYYHIDIVSCYYWYFYHIDTCTLQVKDLVKLGLLTLMIRTYYYLIGTYFCLDLVAGIVFSTSFDQSVKILMALSCIMKSCLVIYDI